jgi:hypothetical protein
MDLLPLKFFLDDLDKIYLKLPFIFSTFLIDTIKLRNSSSLVEKKESIVFLLSLN